MRSAVVCLSVLLLLATTLTVNAACPSNGNTHSLYVTLNNRRDIMSLDSNGRFVGGVINFTSVPKDVQLEKLRAMTFGVDGNLYVTSALSALSRIIVLSGRVNVDCTRNYIKTFQSLHTESNPLMDHPYDIKFLVDKRHGRSVMFVSNQNSASVTRYCGPRNAVGKKLDTIMKKEKILEAEEKRKKVPSEHLDMEEEYNKMNECEYGEALAPTRYLTKSLSNRKPLPGEFVATQSAHYHLRSVRGMAVYSPRSLNEVESKKHPGSETLDGAMGSRRRAVKDEIRDGPLLLVCDVDGSELLVLSAITGEFLWSYHHRIPFPVQVMIPEKQFERSTIDHAYFYATSKTQGVVYKGELARGAYVTPLLTRQGFQYSSGMAEVPSHDTLYIADRGSNQIVLFGVADSGDEAVTERLGLVGRHIDLGDHPEHLAYVRLADPAKIPFCYELGSSGLKRAPLCSAVLLWFWGFVTIVVVYYGRRFVIESFLKPHKKDKSLLHS